MPNHLMKLKIINLHTIYVLQLKITYTSLRCFPWFLTTPGQQRKPCLVSLYGSVWLTSLSWCLKRSSAGTRPECQLFSPGQAMLVWFLSKPRVLKYIKPGYRLPVPFAILNWTRGLTCQARLRHFQASGSGRLDQANDTLRFYRPGYYRIFRTWTKQSIGNS